MSVIDQIVEHLTELGLKSMRADEHTVILGFAGKQLSYQLAFRHGGPLVSVIAQGLLSVPKPMLAEGMKLANGVNATRLRWGAFWIGPETRSLAFELGFPVEDTVRVFDVAAALGAVASALDCFYPEFARLVWGRGSEDARDSIAKNEDEDDGSERFEISV